jgi:hypothetical protein
LIRWIKDKNGKFLIDSKIKVNGKIFSLLLDEKTDQIYIGTYDTNEFILLK